MGSLTVGGAAAVGTGAFTSVTAERSVSVAVADDSEAFLSLSKISDSANSQDYVDANGNQISLVLDESGNGGSGFNANAETRIDDLLQVSNQGTQPINVWVTFSDESTEESTFNDNTLYFYPGDATDTALNDGEGDGDGNDVLKLGTGESANIGAYVDLEDVDNVEEDITATVHASTARGDGVSDQVDESGQAQSVILQSPATGGVRETGNWITADVQPGPTTTVTVELDGEVYGNGDSEWPSNKNSYVMEVSIDVDNDGLEESQSDDFRFGYAASGSGARANAISNDRDRAPGVSGDGGYLRRNNGEGKVNRVDIGEENLEDGFIAEESDDQLTYTFQINWDELVSEMDDGDNNGLELNSTPNSIIINEIYGRDGGEGVANSNSSNDGRESVSNATESSDVLDI